MPQSNIISCLWDDAYLKKFAQSLGDPASAAVFWQLDQDGELVDFKRKNIQKMMMNFFPALGVKNLVLGDSKNGLPTQILRLT